MGLGAGLDAVESRKISYPYWEPNPDSSAVQPVACRYTDPAVSEIKNT
jgi:hypothetical protein